MLNQIACINNTEHQQSFCMDSDWQVAVCRRPAHRRDQHTQPIENMYTHTHLQTQKHRRMECLL